MFSKTIVLSDAFLDMPISTQGLYYNLGMEADDDGVVSNPKTVIRMCGASKDDLDLLISKRYILSFPSGIVVIKHWRMNNYVKNDRHKRTSYIEELDTLTVDDRGAYTERKDGDLSVLDKRWIKDGYNMETQDRLGKDRLGKDRIGKVNNMASNNPFLDLYTGDADD